MNARHLEQHPGDGKLAARIASYELAARMQLSVPEINDLSTEPSHILKLYGADDTQNAEKAAFARNCILARRLIERGVRFVQLFNGAYASGGKLNWDGHHPGYGGGDFWIVKLSPELPPDSDGDGVSDDLDQCPNSPTGTVVNATGCSIEQMAPCDGPWKNHGEYVSAVVQASTQFRKAGLISH
jgi:hypothetical protein